MNKGSLLRSLTEEEVKKSLSNGGSICSQYIAMLPGYAAACAASVRYGGTSGCDQMIYVENYIRKYC